jgi:uncharacterized protein YjbJ (UPF0337 family)
MTKDIYKSARGKPVDMGALRLKNETERAVGNMKVNARGDAVDDKNQAIQSKPQQVHAQYQQQVQDKTTAHKWDLD